MILPPNDTTVSICGFDFFSVCSFFFFFFSLSQYQIICNPFLKVMFINHEGGEGKTVLPGRICKICGLSALRVSVTVLIFQFTPLFLCSVHRTSLSDLWSSMGACWVYIPPPAQIQHVQTLFITCLVKPVSLFKGDTLVLSLEVLFDTRSFIFSYSAHSLYLFFSLPHPPSQWPESLYLD